MIAKQFALVFFVILSFISDVSGVEVPIIDLSGYHFESKKSITISNKCEFYWNQLLSPNDFKSGKVPVPDIVDLLGPWHTYEKKYELLGYATYRIRIHLSKEQDNLSLFIPYINSASKIWIGDKLMEEIGVVNADRDLYKARFTSLLIPIPGGNTQLDVIIQVVNYTYFKPGITAGIKIGNSTRLFREINQRRGFNIFFVGSLCAMFIYQLFLFFLYGRGRPYLYLGLICLLVAIRGMVTHAGSLFLPDLFPSIQFEIWTKLEFFTVYSGIALFPLYIYNLFPENAPRKPVNFFIIIAALFCFSVIVTPQYVYGRLLDIYHLALLGCFAYAAVSISKAWKVGNPDAKFILTGIIVSFPFILLEIFKNSMLIGAYIPFDYLVEIGVLLFLLFQVYLNLNHYALSFKKLESLNVNLEKIVQERTIELTKANRTKEALLSVVTHDIKAPLNSLSGVLNLFNMGDVDKDNIKELTEKIGDELNRTGILIDNILLWSAGQIKGVQLKIEELNVQQLVKEHIELFSSITKKKRIGMVNYIGANVKVMADKNIVSMVLRNLIYNAIKFSHDDSTVEFAGEVKGSYFEMMVKDSGVGMPEDVVKRLFDPKLTLSTEGTRKEAGTGIGLALCNEYAQKMGSTMRAKSIQGEGSSFYLTLLLAN